MPYADAVRAVAAQWNVLLFILGLMLLAAAAEESGAFAWITGLVLERAGGSRERLFVLLFLTGAVVTLVLSNDATAIVLTPIVYRALAKSDPDPMPFLLSCTFVADTASFGLPFANPANVLIMPHARLVPYLLHLGPPQLAAIALNLGIFLVVFRPRLGGTYPCEPATPPSAAAVRSLYAMAGVAIAYVIALAMRWPLGPVAAIGAIVTLAAGDVPLGDALRHVSKSTFVLLAALFVLVDALEHAGFVRWALAGLEHVARYGALAVDATAAAGAAIVSNAINNLPVAVASSYVAAQLPSEHVTYPLIAGVDVGPNLTLAGSLSTILWMAALRKRGVPVNFWEYAKLGVIVVPPILAVTVLWLWLVP